MKIAIYSRKSKLTEKGESIENQITLCKEYAKNHFGATDNQIVIFEDEGFSGKNTDRPQFQELLKGIKNNEIEVLICYRLDRISRSISDFSDIINELEKYNASFVSIKEQFDTTNPMGRAMMYISSVFAQLERETIAERIKDNMLQLAKSGRWTGGLTPTGFASKYVNYKDNSGNEKKMAILIPIPAEIEIIKTIYNKYLEIKTIAGVETFLAQNDFKSKKDKFYSTGTVRDILRNPVYASADKNLYTYFAKFETEICNTKEEFNGEFGAIPYNRMNKKTGKRKDCNTWILAIGKHEGIISGKDWVKVQSLLEENSLQMPRTGTGEVGLFTGLIKCTKCGSTMRLKKGRPDKNGNQMYTYICALKEVSKLQKCNTPNILGHHAENEIFEYLDLLGKDENLFSKELKKSNITFTENKTEKTNQLELLEKSISDKEKSIKNLIKQLSASESTTAGKYIIQEIESMEKELTQSTEKLIQIKETLNEQNTNNLNVEILRTVLTSFKEIKNIKDIQTKRNLIKIIIKKIDWNGETLNINFNSTDPKK